MSKYIWYATINPGLEPTLKIELNNEGYSANVLHGRVSFEASLKEGCTLIPKLYTPNRVRVALMHRQKVGALSDINRLLSQIPWTSFLKKHTPVHIDVESHKNYLRSDIIKQKASRCMKAILGQPKSKRTPQRLLIYIEQQYATIYLDAGGVLLHKRGWRKYQGKASLRTTIASSMLIAANWTPEESLLDPCCGSGTIVIEAARLAQQATSGYSRSYAFEDWKGLNKSHLTLGSLEKNYSIIAADKHSLSIQQVMTHADIVNAEIQFVHSDTADLQPRGAPGLIICNPPYVKRLGKNMRGVYYTLGAMFKRFSGWRMMFLCPTQSLAQCVSPQAIRQTSFSNGGIDVGLWIIQ